MSCLNKSASNISLKLNRTVAVSDGTLSIAPARRQDTKKRQKNLNFKSLPKLFELYFRQSGHKHRSKFWAQGAQVGVAIFFGNTNAGASAVWPGAGVK